MLVTGAIRLVSMIVMNRVLLIIKLMKNEYKIGNDRDKRYKNEANLDINITLKEIMTVLIIRMTPCHGLPTR